MLCLPELFASALITHVRSTQTPKAVPVGIRDCPLRPWESAKRRFNLPRKQHAEEQIIAAFKRHEAGEKTADICGRWA